MFNDTWILAIKTSLGKYFTNKISPIPTYVEGQDFLNKNNIPLRAEVYVTEFEYWQTTYKNWTIEWHTSVIVFCPKDAKDNEKVLRHANLISPHFKTIPINVYGENGILGCADLIETIRIDTVNEIEKGVSCANIYTKYRLNLTEV